LVLIHHPLDWLSEIEGTNIKESLHAKINCILRGHLHKSDVESVVGVSGVALHLAAGAAYQTRKWPNRALYAGLDEDRITVFPIRYEDEPSEVWTLDTSLFVREPNYEKTFQIPRLKNAKRPPPPPSARSDLIGIPILTWPDDLTAKGEMPDSMMLRPESRIVRFHPLREPLRDTIVGWAIDPAQPIKLRLQAGEGGAGKTRLMIEVCDKLEGTLGWRAGFLDRSQEIETGLPGLLREGKPCFVVLDYAESRKSEIVALVKAALNFPARPLFRIALLAREGGDWWDRLLYDNGSDQAVAVIL
jgi:hypothetical protein